MNKRQKEYYKRMQGEILAAVRYWNIAKVNLNNDEEQYYKGMIDGLAISFRLWLNATMTKSDLIELGWNWFKPKEYSDYYTVGSPSGRRYIIGSKDEGRTVDEILFEEADFQTGILTGRIVVSSDTTNKVTKTMLGGVS